MGLPLSDIYKCFIYRTNEVVKILGSNVGFVVGVSIPCPFFNPGIPELTYANPGIPGPVPGLKIFSYTSKVLQLLNPVFDGKMDEINVIFS
jgi:hypothetical protein